MSINSAQLAGVSGLVANSSALAAISDNIANANTVGYKEVSTEFQDLVTSSTISGEYNAGGVMAATRILATQQGELQQTSSNTDLGISGQGYFVVTTTPTPSITDGRSFTRSGSFTVDSAGYLANSAGYYLQGWPVATNGTVTINPSDVTKLQSINVGTVGGTANPTNTVSVNANLNANQTLSAAATAAAAGTAGAYNVGSNNMASGAVKPDFTISVPISDSQGGQRTLQLDVLKSAAAPNTWYAELVNPPVTAGPPPTYDVQTGSGLKNGQVAVGSLLFNSDGTINMAGSTLFGSAGASTLTLGASNSTGLTGTQSAWATNLGLNGQTITFNLATAPGGISQYNTASVTQSLQTDGTQFGNLTNVQIDNHGFVTAVYDNGVSRRIAQVALSTFVNPDGLRSTSGDNYQVSSTSGGYNLKTAGSGGAGTIAPSTLESSTVDLSQEFSGLITTQEAYSASAKIITTADQMLQALLNIKQ